jgi:AcrR family transcriptional regulator
MSEIVGEKRKYDSTRRKEQARETQRQIVEAAHRLFITRGWAGSTIEAIAAEGGVAVETVYSVFGSKRAILTRLVTVLVRGDDDPTPLMERAGPQSVKEEPDQRMQLRLLSRGISETLERVGPIFGIMRTAAQTEPEIAALLDRVLKERLANMGRFVEWIAANGPLRKGLGQREAAEIVWTVTSPEVHQLLTMDLGWSREHYAEWLADTLGAVLLP